MPATRIVVPAQAEKGQVIEIRTLINHPMETGFRHDNVGKAIPRNIITRFTCTYAGEQVFAMDLFTGVAANPFVAFPVVATETGELVFEWTDQHGTVTREQRTLTVS
jgi:sulfur-oxidizing protein SoxZ